MFPRIPLPGLSFGLPTYGLFVAVGFVLALALAERLGRRHGFAPHAIQDVAVWMCLAGLVGAKLALLAIERPPLRELWRSLFQGGVFYGGFVGSLVAMVWLSRRRGLSVHAVGDVLAAPLAIGHALGRLGCFMAGCCFGGPCTLPWAVHFHDPLSLPVQSGIPTSQGLHPVQLYEAGGNLALCGIALYLLAHRRFTGQVAWTHVLLYGAFRVGIETFRGDVARGAVGPLSTSQAVGLAAMGLGAVMLATLYVKSRASAPAAAPAMSPGPQPDPPAGPAGR